MPTSGTSDDKKTKVEAMEVEGSTSESDDESDIESSEGDEFESEDFGIDVEFDYDEALLGYIDFDEDVPSFVSERDMEVEDSSRGKKRRREEAEGEKLETLDECIADLLGKASGGVGTGFGTAVATCSAADECTVTEVHVVGRPARSHGSSMGDHTTPFSIVQAVVSDAVSGKSVDDALSGLQKLYEDSRRFPGYGCEWIDPRQQQRFKEEEEALKKALAQVTSSTGCPCKLANLQMAIGRFLEYREMIPLSTLNVRAVSAAGGKGKGESKALKQYKAAAQGGEYPENLAYGWFDQAAVALWATEGAGPGQGREQIGPWQKLAKPGQFDTEGRPVRDPITENDFFEQHCKTLPVLKKGSHPNSTIMGKVLEAQMHEVLHGQVAAIVSATERAARNLRQATAKFDSKQEAMDGIRYAYYCQREATAASELVKAVKPLLTSLSEARKKYEDSLPRFGKSEDQVKELKRLTAAHPKWEELLRAVTANEATGIDLLQKVEAAATRAANIAVDRSRNPKPEPEDLKETQRRIAYKEGLPKSANPMQEGQDDKVDEHLNALEEAENPFGESTIGIQLGKKDPKLQPLLIGLAVQASLKDCLAVDNIRFGGRPMSPFSGTMGSHHIAWVLMCDAVRQKVRGKKLGATEMCKAIDELCEFPDKFRDAFKPAMPVAKSSDQKAEEAGAEAKEDKLLTAMREYASSTANKKARSDSGAKADSEQTKALKDLAKQADSCKSVEGLQLFLSTLMSLINLVPGVSVNETMPDGRAEGNARKLLQKYERLIARRNALGNNRAKRKADWAELEKQLERNKIELQRISAEDLAAAVKKLVDPKANEGARKSINTMAAGFVESAYPAGYAKCKTNLDAWIHQTT